MEDNLWKRTRAISDTCYFKIGSAQDAINEYAIRDLVKLDDQATNCINTLTQELNDLNEARNDFLRTFDTIYGILLKSEEGLNTAMSQEIISIITETTEGRGSIQCIPAKTKPKKTKKAKKSKKSTKK